MCNKSPTGHGGNSNGLYDVYIAGYSTDYMGNNPKACYWKNGVKAFLGGIYSYAFGIAVFDNNVYVAGSETDSMTMYSNGCYWKNGLKISLAPHKNPAAIAVLDNDIFIAGGDGGTTTSTPIAWYWSNGTGMTLNEAGTQATAYSIAVVRK